MSDQKPKPNDCAHEDFSTFVNIARLLDSGKFCAEITIRCTVCDSPFRFICPDAGVAWDRPVVSVDGLELRAPIEPEGQPQMHARVSFQMPEIPTRN